MEVTRVNVANLESLDHVGDLDFLGHKVNPVKREREAKPGFPE